MTNFIFREHPPGQVRHTALSAHLSRSPPTVAFQRTLATVFNPANACIPTALRANPATASLTQTAHNAARSTPEPFYAWLDSTASEADPDRNLRAVFDRGMEGISRGGQRLQDTDLRAFPWDAALPPGATVVDVGGSRGHFARDLVEMNPSFRVVVQDLPRVVEGLAEEFAISHGTGGGEGGGNVTYQAHDFFDAQPVVGADVYFLRHVMHNHPDAECVAILRALLPALREGGRVLISEYVVPPYEDLAGGLGTKAMR